jgi:deazaflavin-dependent oxidoreductase (nitroreductase family)
MGQEPGLIWRIMQRLNQRVAHNYQLGIGPARVVMLLTTSGRKSGLPRVTPLQFEEHDGIYYLGSARGAAADWFRNIQANPRVQVQIRGRLFAGTAEAVTDAGRVADFFELRLKRHPWMIGLLMRLEGLPFRYTRQDLEHFAAQKAMVVIKPDPKIMENDSHDEKLGVMARID